MLIQTNKFNQTLLFSLLCATYISANATTNQPLAPELATTKQTKALVNAKNSMIVTNNPSASKAAEQILKDGGNATDAAIAAAFMLGLTEPQSSGIGGGGYALSYQNKTKQLIAFDGRETAPASASPNWFLDAANKPLDFESAMLSPLSVGVPSEVALLYAMHQKNGKLAWAKLLAPAIERAKQGFPMSPRLFNLLIGDQQILKNNPLVREIYFTSTGQVKPIASIVKNPDYAKTLELIAKSPQKFYTGKLAQDIVKTVNNQAGKKLYTLRDLADYQVLSYPGVCSSYRDKYIVCSVPPSSSGGVAVQELMGIYAQNSNITESQDVKWVYNFLEASKLAFADRNQYLADPQFVQQPVSGLLDKKYIAARASLVNESQALITPVAAGVPEGIDPQYAPDASPKPHGTTSISIVDKDGNAVSMTVTVEHQFGSHLFTNGFFLNNELTDFSLKPTNAAGQAIANRVEANKRPRSSIAPTMVFDKDGKLEVVTGSPGGSQIICYVAKNLVQILDLKQDAQQAVNTGNLCAANNIPQIEINSNLINFLPQLKLLGESYVLSDMVSGETNIVRTTDGWSGAADPRREGVAIGN